MLLCGDVRQLPPASGEPPFWSTAAFQNIFEIFRLSEDRRHEREPGMQQIKEKFAWGGTLPQGTDTTESIWTVDADVVDFVVDGYLRGWGLSGSNVDLDVGVALFPRRADVNRWNEHALQTNRAMLRSDMRGSRCAWLRSSSQCSAERRGPAKFRWHTNTEGIEATHVLAASFACHRAPQCERR